MSYLIIIFVIALALAPLLHFVPSKAQRKVARLREYAAIHGLFVEFRDIPVRQGAGVTVRPGVHGSARKNSRTIYYGKRVRARGRGPERQISWLSGPEAWVGLTRKLPVPEQLAALPEGIVAATADPDSCGVYWEESGDEADIDRICEVLEALSAALYQ